MWIDPFSRQILKGAGQIPAAQGRGPVVLMYHSLSPGNGVPEWKWSVSEKGFRDQLRLLKSEGWTTVCVRDLIETDRLQPRSVVITFDDGYADNFQFAFQPLMEYGMSATWFIVSGDIGKHSSHIDRTFLPKLDTQQLIAMAEAGMEIGAHTRTHPRLSKLDRARINQEVGGSKEDIEDLLGIPVTSFAYPYGDFDSKCVEAVKTAGFFLACTARTGWVGSEADLLRIRRIPVFSTDTLSAFARKLAFADSDVGWQRMIKYAAYRMCARLGRC